MKLDTKKNLVSKIIKGSAKRAKFDPARLDEIKEAITKKDLKGLIKNGAIDIVQKDGVSRARARARQAQRKKGRQRGAGSRQGSANARLNTKLVWMNKIRLQREFLKELKDKELIDNATYRDLYMKAKGGFFRSKRHIKLYINELGLTKQNGK
jgi:large subunit ribosomal protein L19e